MACSSEPCSFGSTCESLPGGRYACFCLPGLTGANCDKCKRLLLLLLLLLFLSYNILFRILKIVISILAFDTTVVWFRSRIRSDQILFTGIQRQELVSQHTADWRPPQDHSPRTVVRNYFRHGPVAVQRSIVHRPRRFHFRLLVGRPCEAHLRFGQRQDEYHVSRTVPFRYTAKGNVHTAFKEWVACEMNPLRSFRVKM